MGLEFSLTDWFLDDLLIMHQLQGFAYYSSSKIYFVTSFKGFFQLSTAVAFLVLLFSALLSPYPSS